jgi:copper(I)-binding protein
VIRASFGKTTAGRLLLGVGALALLVPAIAGCEAGENAPTLEFHDASAGAQTVFNGIRISDAFVLGAPSGAVPTGSSAGLFLSLYNGSTNADSLTGVTAKSAAGSVAVTGTSVALPLNSEVNLMGPQPKVVLNSLTTPLTAGGYVSVTLDFEHAGSTTLQVPVEAQQFDFATYSAAPVAPAAATPAASAAAKSDKKVSNKKAGATPSATPSS